MEKFEITNEQVLVYLAKQEECGRGRAETINELLDLGVRVIALTQYRPETEFVRLQVEEMGESIERNISLIPVRIEEQIGKYFDPSVETSYTARFSKQLQDSAERAQKESSKRLDAVVETFKEIKAKFDPDSKTSFQEHVRLCLENAETKMSAHFDPENRGSFPNTLEELIRTEFGEGSLALKNMEQMKEDFQGFVSENFESLKDKLIEIQVVKKAREKSSQKGWDYEQEILSRLERFAEFRQDMVEDTTHTRCVGTRSKKGDFLYLPKSGGSIVVEAKNRPMSRAAASAELAECISLRNAVAGVMVFPEEILPSGIEHIGIAGNQLITSDRFLETAMHIAHLFLRKEAGGAFDLDRTLELAKASLQKIGSALKQAQAFSSSASAHFSALISEIGDSGRSLNEMLSLLSSDWEAA